MYYVYIYIYVLCVCIVNNGHGYTTSVEEERPPAQDKRWLLNIITKSK